MDLFHQSPHEIFFCACLQFDFIGKKLFMNFDNNNKIYLCMCADMYINADVVNASFEIMKIFSSFSVRESFNGVIIVNKIDFRSTSLCYGHWRPSHILKGHHPISLRPLTLVSIFIIIITPKQHPSKIKS